MCRFHPPPSQIVDRPKMLKSVIIIRSALWKGLTMLYTIYGGVKIEKGVNDAHSVGARRCLSGTVRSSVGQAMREEGYWIRIDQVR